MKKCIEGIWHTQKERESWLYENGAGKNIVDQNHFINLTRTSPNKDIIM